MIKKNFDESQKNLKKNMDLIQEKINDFESKLDELKSLYDEYKDINDKLISFSNYILNLYSDLAKSGEDIYYPIYFNLKNILLFNPTTINLEDINNQSITSFINSLKSKLNSGHHFIIKNSNISQNLIDYNKPEKNINCDLIILENFSKREVKYNKMLTFTKNKVIGIVNNKTENSNNSIDIYNIKNKNVETSINIKPLNKYITMSNIIY